MDKPKTGDVFTADIYDITSTGEGVTDLNGFKIFTPHTIPGDKAVMQITDVKPRWATAKVQEICEPSVNRKPKTQKCPYADRCGGCPWDGLTEAAQLESKRKQVEGALSHIGGLTVPVAPVIGMTDTHRYRNKAQYKLCKEGAGFYEKKSHTVVPIADCAIQQDVINKTAAAVSHILKNSGLSLYNEKTKKGLLRGMLIRANRKNEVMLVLIANGAVLPEQDSLVTELSKIPDIVSIYLNTNRCAGNRVLGDKSKLLFGRKYLYETLGDKSFRISPSSFFQVNTEQTEKLYDVVKDYAALKPGDTVYDLYCGTGTIGLYLAEDDINLYGIEINKEAVKDARDNARENGVDAEYICGAAETAVKEIPQKPDVIILDPPRKGCDEKLLTLLEELKAPRIVYVSCNPATLARDLKRLSELYNIEKVQPVDLFGQTGHVETVVLMTKVR